MQVSIVDPRKVRDISPQFLDSSGGLKVVDASEYAGTTKEERALFGVRNAFYGLLTKELVNFVAEFIAGRAAIEIGAGHGGFAKALGIRATDSRQQERPEIAAYYRTLKQATIKYGANVEQLDALSAVAKYRPKVVVGSWVTHKYDPARHHAGGNEDGVTEEKILEACDAYLFVGNDRVHAGKSIWTRTHTRITPPWVYSRAANGSPDFIAIWQK
jgi:hypothetical protein